MRAVIYKVQRELHIVSVDTQLEIYMYNVLFTLKTLPKGFQAT